MIRREYLDVTFDRGVGRICGGQFERPRLCAVFGDERFGRWLGAMKALRESLPRGERGPRMNAAVRGFGLEGKLRFPAWFERGEDPPRD